jgi:MtN3 and saliva related transmembrane protein
MDAVFWVGTLAAVCSAVSFVPQALMIIRTRNTKGISVATYLITVSGFSLWVTYGWMLAQWPLIVSNAICLVLSSFILTMKLMPQPTKNAVAATLDPKV